MGLLPILVPFEVLVYCATVPYLGALLINYRALQGTPFELTNDALAHIMV